MGADFCFSAAPMPRWDDDEPIRRPSAVELEWLREDIIGRIVWDEVSIENAECYFPDPDDGSGENSQERAVDELVNFVATWSERRDVGTLCTGDDRESWVVTGGMTWGDDPTDSYAVIAFASSVDIFYTPFMYREHDEEVA